MQSIKDMCEYLKKISEELNFLEGSDKYHALMEYGEDIENFDISLKTDENMVTGCTSEVYIHAIKKKDRIYLKGFSGSHIVRGYLAIQLKALSGLTADEIINNSDECLQKFVNDTDIKATLTPTRANAFGNIFNKIKQKAKEI
jgi:cysteine desulfuration protein SufE